MSCQIWHSLLELLNLQAKVTMFLTEIKITVDFLQEEAITFEEKLGVGAESQDYRIIEKVLPYADEVHEHTSVYQLNELDFMYRQLSSDMQEEYVSLLTVFENLEALYICRNVITVYPDCKSMIDVARQKLMNDPTFKHLSEDCQEYYFDFEAYASHLQEHGKFLVTEHGIFELPE